MPQLMPLFWAFSNFTLLVLAMVAIILYSFGYLSENNLAITATKSVVNWCW